MHERRSFKSLLLFLFSYYFFYIQLHTHWYLFLLLFVISCCSSFCIISCIQRVYIHDDAYSCYLLLSVIFVFPLFLLCKPYINTEYCRLCPFKTSWDAAWQREDHWRSGEENECEMLNLAQCPGLPLSILILFWRKEGGNNVISVSWWASCWFGTRLHGQQ